MLAGLHISVLTLCDHSLGFAGRVAKSEAILSSLEQGSLKLRVRDPASERALRKSSIMQVYSTSLTCD